MAEDNQKDGHTTEQSGHFLRCALALHRTRLKASPSRAAPAACPMATGASQPQRPPAPTPPSALSQGWLWNRSCLDTGSADPDPTRGPPAPRLQPVPKEVPLPQSPSYLFPLKITSAGAVYSAGALLLEPIPPPNYCSYSDQLP